MSLMQGTLKAFFIVFIFVIISCEKDMNTDIQDSKLEETIILDSLAVQSSDTLEILETQKFLFNIPINQDTFLIDKDYNIDFRVEIEGHIIDSTFLIFDNGVTIKRDTTIISSRSLYLSEGLHNISFLIRSIESKSRDTVFFKSKSLLFNVVENLSNRYVFPSIDNGRLKLTWEELDIGNTQKYIVERWLVDDKFNIGVGEKKYYQIFEVENASFIDNYYVGEETEYKITILNNNGNKQDIWYYKKLREAIDYQLSPNPSGGYNIHFTKCKYFNNFGQYYCTGRMNNQRFIQSSNQINDTVQNIADAKFGDEARFWLCYIPKQLPDELLEDEWNIYGKFIVASYGDKSFEYDRIAIINNENVAITSNDNIYKINIESNKKIDSIINENARYGFLRTTPAGDYLYAVDENIYGSPVYLWSTNTLTTKPNHTFQNNFVIPPVSDNLITIMDIPSSVTPSKLALYDVTNGNRFFTTEYDGSSNLPKISSNGINFFIYDSGLKLCSYENSTFTLIWEESDWSKLYRFYDFSPINNNKCYIWDDDKKFSIRSTLDFSETSSFILDLEEIINIDYYNKKIMGYVMNKIRIYNLDDGTLENEIPANLINLFTHSNNTVLIGNTIYNNNGIKYIIK